MKSWLLEWLLTARLWVLFWRRTPRHPLFVMRFRHLAPIRHRPPWLNSLIVTVIGTLAFALMGAFPILVILLVFLLMLMMVMLALGGALRGFIIAGETARGIRLEAQDPTRMSLFQIMPPGQLGIAWLLSVRSIRLSRRFRLFSLLVTMAQWTVGGLALMGVFFSLILPVMMTAVASSTSYELLWIPLTLLTLISIVLWIVFDNLQAPILGVVCGIWGSTIGTRVMVAWIASVGVYLSLMLVCGIITSVLASALLFLTYDASKVTISLWVSIGVMLLTPFISLGLREIAIRGMWAWVCRRMNADGSEVALI